MSTRPPDLPDFDNPPVTEVVLSVQFERLPSFRSVHIGLIWQEFRERFPKTEDQLPLSTVVETFEIGPPPRVGVKVETVSLPVLPRVWFQSEDGAQLVQIQPDRFIHNWRKVGEGDKYPHYEKIREAFREELLRFEAFVLREQIGDLRISQAEITYVNHILASEAWSRHGQLSKLLTHWAAPVQEFLPEPEDVALEIRHLIPDSASGRPIGRLHTTIRSGWRVTDKVPMYQMELTARGEPRALGLDGALGFLDLGREWIVKGFADLTTSTMHTIWRRLNGK